MKIYVFTLFSYEDNEIKAVLSTIEETQEWILEYRGDNEDDIWVEKWELDVKI